MKLGDRIRDLGLIDQVIEEPLGGAHRDLDAMAASLKRALLENLDQLQGRSGDELVRMRQERIMSFGVFKEVSG